MRLAIAFAITMSATARADEFATSPNRPDYEASDKLLMWGGRKALEDKGVTIDGTYSLETFVAPQLRNAATVGGLFTAELDVELDKLVSSKLGTIHVSGFGIHGTGITEELMDLHGVSGNAAERDVRLFEAWIDQPLGPLVLRTGLIAADQQLLLTDQSQTLLDATFGITSQFSANLLGPVYPTATPGASLRRDGSVFEVRAAIYDGSQANDHGIPTAIGPSYLAIGEIEFWESLAFGVWHHGDRGEAVYATLDTSVAPSLGVFARIGISNGPVTTYLDAGFRAASFASRPDDFVSIGIAYARGDEDGETVVEATYEAQLRWLTLQPDFQLMLIDGRTVAIGATRATLTF